jgi:hypothetical protein
MDLYSCCRQIHAGTRNTRLFPDAHLSTQRAGAERRADDQADNDYCNNCGLFELRAGSSAAERV